MAMTKTRELGESYGRTTGPSPLFLLIYLEEAEAVVRDFKRIDDKTLATVVRKIVQRYRIQFIRSCTRLAERAKSAIKSNSSFDSLEIRSEASATATTIGAEMLLYFGSSPFGGFGGPPKNDKCDSFKLLCSQASYLESCKTAAGRTHNLFYSRKSTPCHAAAALEASTMPPRRNETPSRHFMAKQGGLAGANCHGIPQTRPATQSKTPGHVFIGHAMVWVFADEYSVSSLKGHAFSYLVNELAHWTISASTFIPEFGRIVRYVYDCHSIGGRLLPNLVSQFAACAVEDVSCLDGWQELLNEVPDFIVDLVYETTNRLG